MALEGYRYHSATVATPDSRDQSLNVSMPLSDIEAGKIDTVVVYKVDRLTRSLGDFAKIVEVFDPCLSG